MNTSRHPSPSEAPREFLEHLYRTAVSAADAHQVLPSALPADRDRPATVIGAGKAAAAMAAALEAHWRGPLSGQVVTPYGHGEPCSQIEVLEAAHPVPDDLGQRAARHQLDLVEPLGADDLVICLLSGGGSALLGLPAEGITLEEKRAINRALLRSGAAIDEINCVRKHLSAIKGGRLARAAAPAQLMTYAISDVPGDVATVIASGPTVADPTTTADAQDVLARYNIDVPAAIAQWLNTPGAETLKPDDSAFTNTAFNIIGTPAAALGAAEAAARTAGIEVAYLGDDLEGEARDLAAEHAAFARSLIEDARHTGQPRLVLSGGETSVTVRGNGRGGRNAEYGLGLALALSGEPSIYALAADTDGIDGSEDNAGVFVTPDTLARGGDAATHLNNNDSYSFFEPLGDLLITGPTRTNVNDFRAILVLP